MKVWLQQGDQLYCAFLIVTEYCASDTGHLIQPSYITQHQVNHS